MKKVLIDTSVWISHWKKEDLTLVELLQEGRIVLHDLIEGELACGNAKLSKEFSFPFRFLRRVPVGPHREILNFIESKKLSSAGIGYVDVSLLFSCLISNCEIYTLDKNLLKVAEKLRIAFRQ